MRCAHQRRKLAQGHTSATHSVLESSSDRGPWSSPGVVPRSGQKSHRARASASSRSSAAAPLGLPGRFCPVWPSGSLQRFASKLTSIESGFGRLLREPFASILVILPRSFGWFSVFPGAGRISRVLWRLSGDGAIAGPNYLPGPACK